MHHLLRSVLYRLLKFPPTYLVGMVMLRLLRMLKNKTYKIKEEFVTINNFMGSLKMTVNKNSTMGGAIYWFGFHHTSELLYLSKTLKSDMTFVDVGANQGEFSLYAASLLKKGRVLSFEPTEWQLKLLKENKQLNNFDNIEIYEYGLLDKNKELEVFTSNDTRTHHGQHEGLSTVYKSDTRNVSEGIIQLKIFDEQHFETLNRFDVLKIDIEGAELPALRGMEKSIAKFKPVVIIEMGEETFKQAGYSIKDVDAFFTQFGYSPYKFYRGRLTPIESYSYEGSDNLAFIANK